MKRRVLFDTSALVSLGHTNLVDKVLESYTPIVTPSVIAELRAIAKRDDSDGESAKKWLERRRKLQVRKVKKQVPTEKELLDISSAEGVPLVIDDIKAVRKYRRKTTCLFSVHLIFALYIRGEITRAQALLAVQKMGRGRSWKGNAIMIAARVLFE
jgi:rRNA-processing protein FCF1